LIALLDVNVLVALLDASHLHHGRARAWLATHLARRGAGWASCAATLLGCIRVMSLPVYPNAQAPAEVARRLQAAMAQAQHRFWGEEPNLLEADRLDWTQVLSGRQLPDLQLLALAQAQGGRLATFDTAIPARALGAGAASHLLVLP
jgi:uncharacterized protein